MSKSATNKMVKFLALFSSSGFLLLLLLLPLVSMGAFTEQINYQGKLTNASGAAVTDGNYSIAFTLYNAPTGGSSVWTETQTVAVTGGLFSIMLGSVSSLSAVDFNQALYLTINVNGDGEMLPRKLIGAFPNAFNSNKLGGLATTSFLRSDAVNATATIDNLNSQYLSVSGNVGIGTTTPTYPLTVVGTSTFWGDVFIKNSLLDSVGSTGSYGQVLMSQGDSVIWVSTTTLAMLGSDIIGSGSNWIVSNGFLTASTTIPIAMFGVDNVALYASSNLVSGLFEAGLTFDDIGLYLGGLFDLPSIPEGIGLMSFGSTTGSLMSGVVGSVSVGSNLGGAFVSGVDNITPFSNLDTYKGVGLLSIGSTTGSMSFGATGGIFIGGDLSYVNSVDFNSLDLGGMGIVSSGEVIGSYSSGGTIGTLAVSEASSGGIGGLFLTSGESSSALATLVSGTSSIGLNISTLNPFSFGSLDFPGDTSPDKIGVKIDGRFATGLFINNSNPSGYAILATSGLNYFGGSVGIGTTTPLARLSLDNDGAILAVGEFASGLGWDGGELGAGTRLMWVPEKSAFRFGTLDNHYDWFLDLDGSTKWNALNVGEYSFAGGFNTIATGTASFAFGDGALAVNDYAVAFGLGSISSGYGSVAMGENSLASSNNAFAMGYGTIASYDQAVAMGDRTVASGLSAFAMGRESVASGYYSTALGYQSLSSGWVSTALGDRTEASGDASLVSGYRSIASGTNAFAHGYYSYATGDEAIALGAMITVSGNNSIGIGLDRNVGIGDVDITRNNTMAIMGGNLGIGTTTPDVKLSVVGSIFVATLDTNGAVYSNNGILTNVNPSSQDYKNSITPTDLNIDALLGLQVKSFNWNNNGQADFGLIAEEIKDALPELYMDNGQVKGYRADHLPFYLLQIAQRQAKQITDLDNRIASGTISFASTTTDTLTLNTLQSLTGTWSISADGTLTAKKVVAEELLVENGVTVRDKATGQYTCIYVENGAIKTALGECSNLSLAPPPVIEDVSLPAEPEPSPVSTPEPEEPVPEPSPTEESVPSAEPPPLSIE